MIAIIKTLHIAALVVWCAGLLTLPVLLGLHRHITADVSTGAANPMRHQLQHNYTRFRQLTHFTYTALVTPAAIIAIAAGTALIFGAKVFEVWLLAKLAFVAGMVLAHAWLGHLIVQSSEREVHWRMPWPAVAWLVAVPCMLGVLWLVLAKPDAALWLQALPAWATTPAALDLTPLLQWAQSWSAPQEALP